MTLHVQFLTMTSMIAGGFYLGIILDTFRRFSPYWRKNKFLTYFLEICFWLIQTFLLFYILFRVNAGEFRFYIIVACLLGFSMYKALAAPLYNKLLEQIIRVVQWIYYFIKGIIEVFIITPIKWILQIVVTIFLFLIQLVMEVLLFLLKVIFVPIRWIFQLIYSLLPNKFQKILYKWTRFYSIMKNTCIKWLKSITFKRR